MYLKHVSYFVSNLPMCLSGLEKILRSDQKTANFLVSTLKRFKNVLFRNFWPMVKIIVLSVDIS